MKTFVPIAVVGALVAWRIYGPPTEGLAKVQRSLMGTVWEIEVTDRGDPVAAHRAIESAYGELERIDQLMSEWKPASPISRVNSAAGVAAVEVPEELRDLITRSVAYQKLSEKTFDITWRGMGAIWKFDPERFRVPTQQEVETACRRIDSTRIEIHGNTVYLPAGMNIGLGGIAKGYAVDRAMGKLAEKGFTNAMVNGGGDILARGTRLGKPWTLGIQHPRRPHGELLGRLPLRDAAMLTSGDYERFQIANGVRYHHIIDPRTGWPATASSSVTVLASSAEQGVVLAKAVFILGPEKGLELARSQHVEALLVDPQGGIHKTPGFPPLE